MRTIQYTHYHGEGLTLACELEYDPGERETDIDPAALLALVIELESANKDFMHQLDGLLVIFEAIEKFEGGDA